MIEQIAKSELSFAQVIYYSEQLFRGLTTRDIQAHFKEVYGVDVSAGFISHVTNVVMDEVKRWQQRPLDALYPIVYLDCIVVKSQDGGAVANKSVYLALGSTLREKQSFWGYG